MTADRNRQRAAVDLLNVWTGDIYNEWSEDSGDGYVPLVWTVGADGHVQGELTSEELSYDDRAERLGVWADYLGIELQPSPDAAAVRGMRSYTPDGACGVVINVSLITRKPDVVVSPEV
ncbi:MULTISPECIES: hypothetical protein [unclassified Streptomyces]|uniref:hypothetical protein n=1 Tax=unclassified Streptomyces TaxID=2593676 RepID=UPI00364663A5